MFNNNNIINSKKNSNINAKNIILDDEKEISENRELKKSYTFKIIIIAICLLVYWIILMLIYEKDKKYILDNVDDEELFKKYNPMIAGCIQGSRQILARDIIAVILNLINKKVITMDMIPSTSKKEPYRYVITKNEENYNKLDNIEQYVYDWVFDGDDKVDLKYRLEKMPKEKDANKKFKELNKTVEEELAKIILIGKRHFEIEPYGLYKVIQNKQIIKIKNKTKIYYNLKEIANQHTLKGLFAKEVQEKMSLQNITEEEKNIIEKAVEIVFEALE